MARDDEEPKGVRVHRYAEATVDKVLPTESARARVSRDEDHVGELLDREPKAVILGIRDLVGYVDDACSRRLQPWAY